MNEEPFSYGEALGFIVDLLRRNGKMSTEEVEAATRGTGRRCPDRTALFLAKLRMSGRIKGEFSGQRGTWLWWVD